MTLNLWAAKWGVPQAALDDLVLQGDVYDPAPSGHGEVEVQNGARLVEAETYGGRLWRNNSGALYDVKGRLIRFGLGHITKAGIKVMKSGDLIGCRPVLITRAMVGQVFGRFTSFECKHPNWKPSATSAHETGQRNWATLINKLGGIARFITSPRGIV